LFQIASQPVGPSLWWAFELRVMNERLHRRGCYLKVRGSMLCWIVACESRRCALPLHLLRKGGSLIEWTRNGNCTRRRLNKSVTTSTRTLRTILNDTCTYKQTKNREEANMELSGQCHTAALPLDCSQVFTSGRVVGPELEPALSPLCFLART